MESRIIRIANTKTQKKYTIETAATTLGELQDQMTAQGIDFTGMTFTEGLTKTELLNRDSLLPTNVMFRGEPTNELVMLLTNTNKQIKSGIISRKEAYAKIKEMGIQDAISEAEGINWTRVKTDILERWINPDVSEVPEAPAGTVEEARPASVLPDIKTASHPETVEWYYMGLKAMVKNGLLYTDDIAVIADLTTEYYKRLREERSGITDKDVEDIINSL